MASSMATTLACVVVMCMVVGAPMAAQATITCGEVSSKLTPCISYLTGRGPLVPGCCAGVKALNAEAKTTPDRQQACKCLKSNAAQIPGINYSLAGGLAGKCGVSIPFQVSPNVDCSK